MTQMNWVLSSFKGFFFLPYPKLYILSTITRGYISAWSFWTPLGTSQFQTTEYERHRKKSQIWRFPTGPLLDFHSVDFIFNETTTCVLMVGWMKSQFPILVLLWMVSVGLDKSFVSEPQCGSLGNEEIVLHLHCPKWWLLVTGGYLNLNYFKKISSSVTWATFKCSGATCD